jgi:RNA polymerase sigma factor (sigma-70 family)
MVPPCNDISDFVLIRLMADQKVDFAGARDAWGHFYIRHHRFLFRICMSDHGYLLGADGVTDIVHEVFLKAFDHATTFDHGEVCEPVVQERKSRGWLSRIAENVVRDRFRGQPEVCFVEEKELDRLETTSSESDVENQVPESKRLNLIKSGFALLSDVEQTILRATMFWWRPGQQHQRMPNAAMLQLSQQTGKSSENIRQIRARAVKKLEKYVNENLDDEKED